MKKTKILLFTDSLGAGGAQRQLVGLARMLKQSGYDIYVVTYYNQDFYKSYLDEYNIRNYCLTNAKNHFKRIPILFSFFKKISPDVVIAYQETPSLLASLIKFFGGRYKLIVSERNTTQVIGNNERVRFFLYSWADAIVSNSYSQTLFLTERYERLRPKLKTIINFVDLKTYCTKPHELRKIPLITVAASIWPPKNTLGFLEACKILNDRGFQYELEWYGVVDSNNNYLKDCLDFIKSRRMTNVKLLPKTKQIVEKYQNTDFFCLPSFYEGTPNVICEAVACGKPILCSNVCDNSKYVKDYFNGFLFEPNDPQDIALKMQNALSTNREEYTQMCVNSRKIAEENFEENRFLQEYLKIINDLEGYGK